MRPFSLGASFSSLSLLLSRLSKKHSMPAPTRQFYPTVHRMTRRSKRNDYSQSGMYHITINVSETLGHPLGRVVGDASQPDGSDDAPRVELTALGQMVEQELLHSISEHYPMIEVQDHVVMPEHLHFIIEVHDTIVSKAGRKAHLGQVMAGFKKGCNRRYWEMTGQRDDTYKRGEAGQQESGEQRRKPADTQREEGKTEVEAAGMQPSGAMPPAIAGMPVPAEAGVVCSVVCPPRYKVPSRGATTRTPLFAEGYVDVMPMEKGQLDVQRQYIRANPRSRLLRSSHRSLLQVQRMGVDTALGVKALMGYLRRECPPSQLTPETQALLQSRLLITSEGRIDCHTYGDRALLERRLLPVVCHRRDAKRFAEQKARCLEAAQAGAVLVSARIAPGEQEIMDEAAASGYPTVLIQDNGMPERYHPSAERIERCQQGQLLILTPWQYFYRNADEDIHVAECKTMNCVAQALCRLKDSWWQEET